MSSGTPSRRLPLLNAVRSNNQLKDDYLVTEFGKVACSMATYIDALRRQGLKYNLQVLRDELVATALYVDGFVAEVPSVDGVASMPAQSDMSFNTDEFPTWLSEYIATNDAGVLRALTKDQAADLFYCPLVTVDEIYPNGQVLWSFVTNPDRKARAYLPAEVAGRVEPGQTWLFRHNGKKGIDSLIVAGYLINQDRVRMIANDTSNIWKKYN